MYTRNMENTYAIIVSIASIIISICNIGFCIAINVQISRRNRR